MVKRTFNEKFINKSTGIYIDGESSLHSSLHANMMALAFDLVPEENKKAVIDFIKTCGMACSVYDAQYLLEGLNNAGEADYALSLLTASSKEFSIVLTGNMDCDFVLPVHGTSSVLHNNKVKHGTIIKLKP